jgi:hypothetical protein
MQEKQKKSHADGLFLAPSPAPDNVVTHMYYPSLVLSLPFLCAELVQPWLQNSRWVGVEPISIKGAMRRVSFTIERPRQLKEKNANSLYRALTLREQWEFAGKIKGIVSVI